MISTSSGERGKGAGEELKVDPARGAVYLPEVLQRVPSLLSQLDREPHSRSYGSFDRDQWAWKFRDFPLGMLQVGAYPLAMLWRVHAPENPYWQNPRVLEWIDGAIGHTLSRQRRNGAFDAFAPNEQDPGPTLGIAHGICEAYRYLGNALHGDRAGQIQRAIRRAADFALHRDEMHGFISNHQALFARAFHSAYELLGDSRYRARADGIIDGILEHQSPDGWYDEYGGPDPGYESLGIFHLAMYWRRTRSARLLDSLRRSLDFYAHCVHPDGSVGGAYGSRHTSLYFPGGFEILSSHLPVAAGIAEFMRHRLRNGNVVTCEQVDDENLPPLMYSCLEACLVSEPPLRASALPCHAFQGVRMFADASVVVAGTPHYYAVVHAGRGGMVRVHSRETGEIAYEDAGYFVTSGTRAWASQLTAASSATAVLSGSEVAYTTRMGVVSQELLTPVRFLVLRVLNLTAFRSPRVGSWIRRHVVARLITSRRSGPVSLTRTIRLDDDELRFSDRLELDAGVTVDGVALPRAFTAIHMGSAKYFHPAELMEIPSGDVSHMAADLRTTGCAAHDFSVCFGADTPAMPESSVRRADQVTSATGTRP